MWFHAPDRALPRWPALPAPPSEEWTSGQWFEADRKPPEEGLFLRPELQTAPPLCLPAGASHVQVL